MRHTNDRFIGFRASDAVRKKAEKAGMPVRTYLRKLGLSNHCEWNWRTGESVPSIYALQALALDGVDVGYILTGRKPPEDSHD